jgi:hypothetical protein
MDDENSSKDPGTRGCLVAWQRDDMCGRGLGLGSDIGKSASKSK